MEEELPNREELALKEGMPKIDAMIEEGETTERRKDGERIKKKKKKKKS